MKNKTTGGNVFAAFFVMLGIVSFAAAARADAGHGFAEPHGGGSAMMTRMMDMMRGNLNKTQAVDCKTISDVDIMEHGEEFMEQMMGDKDAHEKMEAAMNKEGHDNMHMMMGAWATGCVDDEVAGAISKRVGVSARGGTQSGQSMAIFGVVIGILIGFILNKFFFTKAAA